MSPRPAPKGNAPGKGSSPGKGAPLKEGRRLRAARDKAREERAQGKKAQIVRLAEAAAAASPHPGPLPGETPEATLIRLQRVIAAQKWDIEGFAEQRDELLARLERLETGLAAKDRDVAAAEERRLAAEREAARLRAERDQAEPLLRVAGETLAALAPLLESTTWIVARPVFAHLLTGLGLIDSAHYLRQCAAAGEKVRADEAVWHYLDRGEALGLSPHPLFHPVFYRAQLPPTLTPPNLFAHYLIAAWREGYLPHPLFDAAYYVRHEAGETAGLLNPWLHFVKVGAALGLAPHPLFLPRYYAAQAGLDETDSLALLRHYLEEGGRAGLSPSPLFDPGFYRRRYPDVDPGIDPLLHYLAHGDLQGRMPNIGFDPEFYRAQVSEGIPPFRCTLAHFVTEGEERGLAPHPLFDPVFYREVHPDIRRAMKNTLLHYLEHGEREGRAHHPLIDRDHFLAQAWPLTGRGPEPLRLLVEDERCRRLSPSPLFDAAHYGRAVSAEELGPWSLFEHFLRAARRGPGAPPADPHPLFSVAHYERQVDWRARSADPLTDYLRFGAKERTAPHPLFDAEFYLTYNKDVARGGGNPLLHYLQHGGRGVERRWPHPLFVPEFFLEQLGRVPEEPHLLAFLALPPERLVNPHPLFDCAWYLEQRPDLAQAGINPLLHYVTTPPGEAANPHPLFDEAFYLTQKPELAGGKTPLLWHYLTEGYKEHLSPHPFFDARYVAEQSPDLVKNGIPPLYRYVAEKGFREFNPVPWFDSISYWITLKARGEDKQNPLVHFLRTHPGFTPPAPPPRPPRRETRLKGVAVAALRPAARAVLAKRAGGAGDFTALERFLAEKEVQLIGALPRRVKKVAFYAIYWPEGGLSPTHRAVMARLRAEDYAIALLKDTREEADAFLAAAREYADLVMLRKNGGRDFASWVAATALLFAQIGEAEHWLYLNDSLLGPVADMGPMFAALAQSPAEFWALTESFEQTHHLQSSLFVLRPGAFLSPAFWRFLAQYPFPEEKIEIVRQGELGLSQALLRAGIRHGVMAPYAQVVEAWLAEAPARLEWLDALAEQRLDAEEAAMVPPALRAPFAEYAAEWLKAEEEALRRGDMRNPQYYFWDTLIRRFAYPFLKKDLTTANPVNIVTVPMLRRVVAREAWAPLLASLAPGVMPSALGREGLLRLTPEVLARWRDDGRKAGDAASAGEVGRPRQARRGGRR